MRINPIPLMACLLCLAHTVSGQDSSGYLLRLNGQSFIPAAGITPIQSERIQEKMTSDNDRAVLMLQFEVLPDLALQGQLKAEGIRLLNYIPNNTYTALLTRWPGAERLRALRVRSVMELTPVMKMQPVLTAGIFPIHAVKVPGTVDLWMSFPAFMSAAEVKQELAKMNVDLLPGPVESYRILQVRIAQQRVAELASRYFVEYLETVPQEPVTLNNKSIANSRANVLRSSLAGQRNLLGQGVVVGVGDDATTVTHGDFTGRVIDRAASSGGAHGVHVTGIAGGGGIVNEKFTGYAPMSTIVSQIFAGIIYNAPAYVLDHGMVITNNSYANNVTECFLFGRYSLTSSFMDQMAFQQPQLLNIFAAGNSAGVSCSPYPASFGTVVGDYQTAKNVITVGSTSETGASSGFSSRGPVKDGRIKPEIVAQGGLVYSSWPVNIYTSTNGTSMAAPAVSGGAVLLTQRYRQLNGNANPKNGLLKALLCNGATDMGNAGPDYAYGFGWMNLLRSVTQLESGFFYTNNIITGAEQTQTITVPPNTAQLKVMLYWNDPEASLLTPLKLVNDLDLELETPSSSIVYPFVLDTLPANVNNVATTGADHINNIEQAVVNAPAAGNYTIRVKGTAVPQNAPQEYHVVYDIIPVSTLLTYPMGGEKLKPADSVYISWDSYGDPISDFTLEYSLDGGGNWTVIDANVPAASRLYKWFLPNVSTYQARVRVTRNSNGMQSVGQNFVILGAPAITLDPAQCPGYIKINWTSVTGATDYEVMLLPHSGPEYQSVAITTGNTYTLSGLSRDSFYYVSVRARISGNPGFREGFVSRGPNSGNCTGSYTDNDISLDSLVYPAVSGRLYTSTAFTASSPIKIRVRNMDDVATSGNISVSYTINGGPPVTETWVNPDIPGGSSMDYTFSATADLSALGTYVIVVSATRSGDPALFNDTQTRTVKQLDNPVIDLTTVLLEDFETVPVFSQSTKVAGLNGLDRYDFTTSHPYGRIRSFINTGMAYSGSKALTMDVSRYVGAGAVDSLTGTYNLSSYNAATDDIRFDFRYKNHRQVNNAANRVWVRGDDGESWIEAYNLFANQNANTASYKFTGSIELSDLLLYATPAPQDFSSSFQIRWGQFGQHLTADKYGGAGYSFDDIRLYKVTDDMHLLAIDTPLVNSCGLSSNTPVRIRVRNTRNSDITTVPVRYRVNGGAWVTEDIPFIAANDTAEYTFTGTANLLAPGNYLIEAQVVYPTDTYPVNDTSSIQVFNVPLITVTNSNPHLQDFEAGNGDWYTLGLNSSWEYGTPASYKIKRAASGAKAWKTRLAGTYNDYESSYLYSPCFDVSGTTNPTLSFSVALDLEDCGGVVCDGAYVEYSLDGKTWSRLGANGQGTNWYNKIYSGNYMWSVQNYDRWHVATIPLSVIPVPVAQLTQLRFRFYVFSDVEVNREGIAIDDIHVYGNPYGIYTGTGTSPVVNQPALSGSGWVDFVESGTGKLIASVHPNGQNMGSTDVQSYVHTGTARFNSLQFYHNRNITVKPATVSLADSATVRFYFLDTETEALINATGCGPCVKPAMAYELGVTKYSDPNDANEDGTLANNAGGIYTFIVPSKTRIVPFDQGYYAEFKVKDFSEFWLNNGWLNGITPLPLKLTAFSARKINPNDVLLEWTTMDETDVDRFEVEVAAGNAAYQLNQFVKIGSLPSWGNSSTEQRYSLLDAEPGKTGIRYYRLRMIDRDGTVRYSPIRPVLFSSEVKWQAYPNPTDGWISLIVQAPERELLQLRVLDVTGRLVRQQTQAATGFVQKIGLDLRDAGIPPGLYLLEVTAGERKQSFRIMKQ